MNFAGGKEVAGKKLKAKLTHSYGMSFIMLLALLYPFGTTSIYPIAFTILPQMLDFYPINIYYPLAFVERHLEEITHRNYNESLNPKVKSLKFFLLAIFFLFISCTDVQRDNPYDSGGINYMGDPIDPIDPIPPPVEPSSSSIEPSSSSAVPSSSSVVPSSSSIIPSSSSEEEEEYSSSEMEQSSSSVAPGIAPGPTVYYEGETYETIVIGSQTWMARNLNYDVEGSKCYNDDGYYCDIFGRLYDWYTAMEVCHDGWHLPSDVEWDILGSNGTSDEFGALLGGYGNSDGSFYNVGDYGSWWSRAEYDSDYAYFQVIDYGKSVGWTDSDRDNLRSVRCLKN